MSNMICIINKLCLYTRLAERWKVICYVYIQNPIKNFNDLNVQYFVCWSFCVTHHYYHHYHQS